MSDFDNYLIRPCLSEINSRKDVNLEILLYNDAQQKKTYDGVPIIAANMDSVGTIEMAKALEQYHIYTALHKFIPNEDIAAAFPTAESMKYVFYTVGMKEYPKLTEFAERYYAPPNICVDVANGYTKAFRDYVAVIRKTFPYSVLLVGNVATFAGVQALRYAGADIVKIGVGSGSYCATRRVAGVGINQINAITECLNYNIPVCSDGGCETSGDVAKALAAGADLVMIGSILAGHDECGGDVVDGKMLCYGMSSIAAMTKHYGGMNDYRADEGIQKLIPEKGSVHKTIQQLLGGLRSACSYTNCQSIDELSRSNRLRKI